MDRRPTNALLAPALVAGVTVALATATVVLHVVRSAPASGLLSGQVANAFQAGLVFGLIGAAVLRDAPENPLGTVLSAAGLVTALSAAGDEYAVLATSHDWAGRGAAGWLAAFAWAPGFLAVTVMVPLLFPDGTVASPRWRWPARLAIGGASTALLLVATTQEAFDDNDFGRVHNPFDLPLPDETQLGVALVLLALASLVAVAATAGVLLRMRRVPAALRPRYAWFATAVLLALTQVLPLPPSVTWVLNVASFVALGIGVLRHGLFEVEPYLPRIVVYLGLLGLALGAYLLVAVAVGAEVGAGLLPALVTAGAALLLASLQGRLVQVVRRVLYGERDDADSALTRLGDRLAATLGTSEALPASVEAVRRTLRVPHASISLAGEDAPIAGTGTTDRVAELPLEHAGATVGTLRVGLRAGERSLSERDAALLARFTPHLAAVANDIRTNRELQRSREQLVTAREAERSRIHRDLHDGLGPALAGISLGLETATRATGRDPEAASRMLADLRTDVAGCVDDVRRIVADLRPTSLDESDLLGALKRRADLLATSSGGTVAIAVDGDADLCLPPALEVAAFRIVGEAMTNAVRHGRPRTVRVRLGVAGGRLRLSIVDDGHGAAPGSRGTGLDSMRLRAEELGGWCTVRFRAGAGTTVDAELPVPELSGPSPADSSLADSSLAEPEGAR